MSLKEQILNLSNQNKSYNEICSILNCSKGTISYYLGNNQLQKTRTRNNRWKQQNVLKVKVGRFLNSKYDTKNTRKIKNTWLQILKYKIYHFFNGDFMNISANEIVKHLQDNPVCYLTGEQIDLTKPDTYELDHKIPKSKGGLNTFENLGLTTKQVNQCKSNLSSDEFIALCSKVTKHNSTPGGI